MTHHFTPIKTAMSNLSVVWCVLLWVPLIVRGLDVLVNTSTGPIIGSQSPLGLSWKGSVFFFFFWYSPHWPQIANTCSSKFLHFCRNPLRHTSHWSPSLAAIDSPPIVVEPSSNSRVFCRVPSDLVCLCVGYFRYVHSSRQFLISLIWTR